MTKVLNDGISSYVNIVPVKANFADPVDSSQLYITSLNDNRFNTAIVFWQLRSPFTPAVAPTLDSDGNVISSGSSMIPGTTYSSGNYTITGAAYAQLSSDNTYLFNILLTNLGLTAA